MISLFQSKPVLDEESIQWMLDVYSWALRNFDARVFFEETILVTPTNECFPGEKQTAFDKADLILQQVKRHASMAAWPVELVEEDANLNQIPELAFEGSVRGQYALAPKSPGKNTRLPVSYRGELLRNPQIIISDYAQILAHYLGGTTSELPPGGAENWPHCTELLGVFMGFGLMFANTAYNVRVSSCGSCQGPSLERVNYLSQYDICYALAIFAELKEIPSGQVLTFLKKSLHPFYKKALKDIRGRSHELNMLKEYRT